MTPSSPDVKSETGAPDEWKRKVGFGLVLGGGILTIVWASFLLFLVEHFISFRF
jgi:hypothetical protein